LTIVSTLTIGIPGFFLAFGSGAPRARSGFTRRVLRFTIPAGTATGCATFACYLVARASPNTDLVQARTTALLAVFAMALWVLVLITRPFNVARAVLVAAMAGVFFALFSIALSRRVFSLSLPPAPVLLATACIVAFSIGVLTVSRRRINPGTSHTPDSRMEVLS
jgi:cation-transporting ATPase E